MLRPKLPPLLPTGDGDAGVRSPAESLKDRFKELDPILNLRPVSLFPFTIAFWNKGLADGEKEEARIEEFSPIDKGEDGRLPGLGTRDAESRYLGGVMYCVPGVAGGVLLGSSPRRARCEGVRGMSTRSSFGRNKGYSAVMMLINRYRRKMERLRSGYVGS